MKYVYYPGCSLKSSGKPYEESLLEVFRKAELDVEELDGWNCCGATAYMSVDESDAMALAGRNLALAEKQRPKGKGEIIDMIAPCSACYLVLMKAKKQIEEHAHLGPAVQDAFSQAGLEYLDWLRRPARRSAPERRRLASTLCSLADEQNALGRRLRRLWLARSAISNLDHTRLRLRRSVRSLRRA